MDLKILYEDNDVLVIDKPAGIIVFSEEKNSDESQETVIALLLEKYPDLKNVGAFPRYGIVHRLDKDTSGLLLVAKTAEGLIFLQKQFSAHTFSSIKDFKGRESWDETSPALLERGGKNSPTLEKKLEKKYITLVCGNVKEDRGIIHTLIGRANSDPRKQAAHSLEYKGKTGLREAITDYKVLEKFADYTLLEVGIKTGRKHQIRCHLAYIHHPIAGDKMYGFKDSPKPEGLERQFLHASYLKIKLPSGTTKEFTSELPIELKNILINLGAK